MKEQPPVPTAEQQKALAEYALTQDERYRKLLDLARGKSRLPRGRRRSAFCRCSPRASS
jgi:hypothetical protein